MQNKYYFRFSLFLLAVFWAMSGCQKETVPALTGADQQRADVAVQWFDKLYELTKVCPGFTPPVAARAFGYAGVALYESVVPGMPDYRSLSGKLTALPTLPAPESGKNYYWPACANAALAYMAKNLYANMPADQLTAVELLENQFVQQFTSEMDAETLARSAEYGREIAKPFSFGLPATAGTRATPKISPLPMCRPSAPANGCLQRRLSSGHCNRSGVSTGNSCPAASTTPSP
ncbi:MAG: hypothetical protein IPM98_07880 [Lewinellaceae bacterium]|nr:hypothetical protein [Lewinellaceae bacterium]